MAYWYQATFLLFFKRICSPVKQNLESRAVDFDRRQSIEKRRIETTNKQQLAVEAAEKRSNKLVEEKKRLEEEKKLKRKNEIRRD